ncbi:hypothetical protein ABKU27_07490 [Enterobacter hormaechei]
MATTPTQKPVPSESPIDLKYNAGKIDEFVTSMGWTYTDRFGNKHYTIEDLRWLAQQAISQFGYITLDSFEDGNKLTLPNQILHLEATGEYYRWDGPFPKDVPENSTPETTGGIGPGAWLSVGDATLRGEVFAINGGVTRGFQTVADMKSFGGIVSGHTYSTSGYYAAGDGGGALYIAETTGSTPDGYSDHVASNGLFLRIISHELTDLNCGVKTDDGVLDVSTAWNNRNALQYGTRNERYNSFTCKAPGVYCCIGAVNVARDNYHFHVEKGTTIHGYYDDPSIPQSTKSQGGGFLSFGHFFDSDNGDFIPWQTGDTRVNSPCIGVAVRLDGEVSTIYRSVHSNQYNNNAIAFLKAVNCEVYGSGGVGESDHRGVNFDGIATNAPSGSDNRGGSINCKINISYINNCVDNPAMILADINTPSFNSIKIGSVGIMRSGGYNSPIVVNVGNAADFLVEIGSCISDNVIKPALVVARDARSVKVRAGIVNGVTSLLYSVHTLDNDVEVEEIYNTSTGIIRAGTESGKCRTIRLAGVKATDSNFAIAYSSQNNSGPFQRLIIENNNFAFVTSSFQFFGGKNSAALPVISNILDNVVPTLSSVTELNYRTTGITTNLATPGNTTAVVNTKNGDWNYTKMTVMALASGVLGSVEIDLRTRFLTNNQVNYMAGAIAITTTLSGSTITIGVGTSGATLQFVTLHN